MDTNPGPMASNVPTNHPINKCNPWTSPTGVDNSVMEVRPRSQWFNAAASIAAAVSHPNPRPVRVGYWSDFAQQKGIPGSKPTPRYIYGDGRYPPVAGLEDIRKLYGGF